MVGCGLPIGYVQQGQQLLAGEQTNPKPHTLNPIGYVQQGQQLLAGEQTNPKPHTLNPIGYVLQGQQLLAGEVLLAVDGRPTSGISPAELREMMAGSGCRSRVVLLVCRGDGHIREVTVKRTSPGPGRGFGRGGEDEWGSGSGSGVSGGADDDDAVPVTLLASASGWIQPDGKASNGHALASAPLAGAGAGASHARVARGEQGDEGVASQMEERDELERRLARAEQALAVSNQTRRALESALVAVQQQSAAAFLPNGKLAQGGGLDPDSARSRLLVEAERETRCLAVLTGHAVDGVEEGRAQGAAAGGGRGDARRRVEAAEGKYVEWAGRLDRAGKSVSRLEQKLRRLLLRRADRVGAKRQRRLLGGEVELLMWEHVEEGVDKIERLLSQIALTSQGAAAAGGGSSCGGARAGFGGRRGSGSAVGAGVRRERDRAREERERVMHWVVRCWRSCEQRAPQPQPGHGVGGLREGARGSGVDVPMLGVEELVDDVMQQQQQRFDGEDGGRHWNEYVVDALLADLQDQSEHAPVVLQALLGILNVIATKTHLALYVAGRGGINILTAVLSIHISRPRIQVLGVSVLGFIAMAVHQGAKADRDRAAAVPDRRTASTPVAAGSLHSSSPPASPSFPSPPLSHSHIGGAVAAAARGGDTSRLGERGVGSICAELAGVGAAAVVNAMVAHPEEEPVQEQSCWVLLQVLRSVRYYATRALLS